MKKKLLFVIESLVSGGAEKSLVTLLNLIDYTKYDIDLQLFSYGGDFQSMVPAEVNLLPELPYFAAAKKSIAKEIFSEPRDGINRVRYSIALRSGHYNHPQKAILFWKNVHNSFKIESKVYDVAIAYAQGTPTFYVADCIKADKKIAWVNVTYKPEGAWRDYVTNYYNKYDAVSCVSMSAKEIFELQFPEHKEKATLIYDINDYNTILNMATLPSSADEEMCFPGVKILTVGRLAAQKGYDLAIDACQILKNHGYRFKWYVLGKGQLEEEIKQQIKENELEDDFILLGTRPNPYPYYHNSDIYVQTSKFEGFGLAIAEARMLNIPVVTTRFDAVYDQMVENINGLVVDMNAEAIAHGIQKLIEDKGLYEDIKRNLQKEKKGNIEEIKKFYSLVEGKEAANG